jgi:hypothetical protein
MLANIGHYLRGLSDRVKVLPVARTGPLRVAAEAVSAPVEAVPQCSPTLTECPKCRNDFRKCDLATTPLQEPSIEQQLQNAREDFTAMKALTESGATEIARLTAELAQANAMCESLAVSVQDLANAKAAVDEAHAIELQEVQKDAGRYRWLVREVCTGSIGFGGDGGWLDATDRDQWSEWIDANIPAAMTKEKPHGSL